MANQVNDGLLRPLINACVKAAWSPTKIIDNTARLPALAADLPYAVVALVNMTQDFGGLRMEAQTYRYEITGVFGWPASGTINDAMISRANSLMAQLTESPNFGLYGRGRRVTEITFDSQGGGDDQEPVYSVTVTLELTVFDSQSN